MIIYRTKQGGIISEFAFREGSHPTKAIILCDGLPSAPCRKEVIEFLANQGFLVFYPRYRGTWESEGEFLSQSPVNDIQIVVEAIRGGAIEELYANQIFKFDVTELVLVGVSFGGSVALSSSALPGITKVVAFCPVVDFRTLGTEYPEQDLAHLARFMRDAFTNGYRFNQKNWDRLLKGQILDPGEQLGNPSAILIVHCKDDTTVDHRPVIDFAQKHGIAYKLLPEGGHFSFAKISEDLWRTVLS